MAQLDFLPFHDGQKITAEDLNALVAAIQDGSIFLPGNVVGDLIIGLSERVATLEAQVAILNDVQATQRKTEVFVLVDGQQIINLESPPTVDGELVFLRGQCLEKNTFSPAATHDYTISGKVVTLDLALSAQILAGDQIMVSYRYVVGT